MLVSLTIKEVKNKSWISKLLAFMCLNKIDFEIKTVGIVKLLHITINKKNKRIPWKRISKLLKNKTKNILCSEDISLPEKYGFSRFNTANLYKEFCKNAAISVLKMSHVDASKIKISLFDPTGRHSEILTRLILFSNQITVITYNTKKYLKEQEKIMQEFGASILVSNKSDWLFESNIIVAPDKITKSLPSCQSCLIFTSERNSAPLKGIIYHDYNVAVPSIFQSIMPADLKPEYFLSAIYDKYNIFRLKQLIPQFCISESKKAPVENIARELLIGVN